MLICPHVTAENNIVRPCSRRLDEYAETASWANPSEACARARTSEGSKYSNSSKTISGGSGIPHHWPMLTVAFREKDENNENLGPSGQWPFLGEIRDLDPSRAEEPVYTKSDDKLGLKALQRRIIAHNSLDWRGNRSYIYIKTISRPQDTRGSRGYTQTDLYILYSALNVRILTFLIDFKVMRI